MVIHRVVVKFGTANLCNESGHLDQNIFNNVGWQVVNLQDQNIEVVIVSSGGMKAGQKRIEELRESGNLKIDTSYLGKKEIAGIGARHLLNMWGKAFEPYGRDVGQIWVTYRNWADKGERSFILSSTLNYLRAKVPPVVNEADVISDSEIKSMVRRISENDRLATMFAFLVEADAILFLTDEGGIYEDDPKRNPLARMYAEVSAWAKPEIIGISDNTSGLGTGGMIRKWREASRCAKRGMQVAIAGNENNVITRFVEGEPVGTKIGAVTTLKQK